MKCLYEKVSFYLRQIFNYNMYVDYIFYIVSLFARKLSAARTYSYYILLGGLIWKVKKLKQNYPFLRVKRL